MVENGTQEKELTAGQMKAIAALLTGLDTPDVCKQAGCSTRTLYRWKGEPAFGAALRAGRLALLEAVTAKLRGRAGEAVDTLHALLTCDKPTVQARAAEAILRNAFKAAELEDVAERLAAIEKMIEAQNRAKEDGLQ